MTPTRLAEIRAILAEQTCAPLDVEREARELLAEVDRLHALEGALARRVTEALGLDAAEEAELEFEAEPTNAGVPLPPCADCGGKGYKFDGRRHPSGHTFPCPTCRGWA